MNYFLAADHGNFKVIITGSTSKAVANTGQLAIVIELVGLLAGRWTIMEVWQ